MASILLVRNEANESSFNAALREIKNVTNATSYALAAKEPADLGSATFVTTKNSTVATAILNTISSSNDNLFVIVDARLGASAAELSSFIAEASKESSDTISYMALEIDGERIEFGEIGSDSLVSFLSSEPCMPTLCVAISKDIAESCLSSGSQTSAELIAEMVFKNALASGNSVASARARRSALNAAALQLSANEKARVLAATINSANIEDLFPSHDWQNHQAESAAASYHTLAALFIRLGDTNLASECLRLGDSFEDSPRSLALKGLIARDRGEMLGAVANMVSSLQQYELRKKNDDGKHYLSFKPSNLEVINTNLQAGLMALNKRDNKTALEHFTEAVFNFDTFYKDYGIAQ